VDGSNDAPDEATNSGISDGQTDVGGNVTLTVTVSDTDADLVDVYFYTADDELIGVVTGVASGQTASVQWTGLSDASEYEWYVTVSDGESETPSDIWKFYTTGWTDEEEDPVSVPSAGALGLFLLAASMLFSGTWALRKRKK
jgi:hypothetical protein